MRTILRVLFGKWVHILFLLIYTLSMTKPKKTPKFRSCHAVAAKAITGGGTHKDKRTKRLRTRGPQKREAMRGWE